MNTKEEISLNIVIDKHNRSQILYLIIITFKSNVIKIKL